jgi:hypothetical protein
MKEIAKDSAVVHPQEPCKFGKVVPTAQQRTLTLHLNAPSDALAVVSRKVLAVQNVSVRISKSLYGHSNLPLEEVGGDGVWCAGVDAASDWDDR